MSLRDEIRLGHEARKVFDNEALKLAFQLIKQRRIERWLGTHPEDLSDRESSWYALQALEEVKTELRILLDNGEIAAQALERQQKQEK
jgi:hypothetical protein